MKALASVISAVLLMLTTSIAHAAQPEDWGLWTQPAGSDMMASIEWFNFFTLVIITVITVFVLALLVWVMVRYNSRSNPNPSKTTHNNFLEFAWTVVPILILVIIAIPSFDLLNSQFKPGTVPSFYHYLHGGDESNEPEEPTLTIKAIGQTWYWDYEYQDESEISFSANLIGSTVKPAQSTQDALAEREALGKTDLAMYPELLVVDNEVVVPVGETIRILVTADAGGVIHNWAMPAFGIKMDAIPGRLNETWFKANKEGIYYGQCSELCGVYHAYMPIAVRAVSQDQFDQWQTDTQSASLEEANKNLIAAIEADRNTKLASNQAEQ